MEQSLQTHQGSSSPRPGSAQAERQQAFQAGLSCGGGVGGYFLDMTTAV